MQLMIADNPYGLTGLYLRSYLRVDTLHEVPMEVLEAALSHGRHLELKEKSHGGLIGFLRRIRMID